MLGGDQTEGGDRGGQVGAGLDLIDLGGDGIERGADDGVVKLALRLVHLGQGLQVFGGAGNVDVGIAGEAGQLDLGLHLQSFHCGLVGRQPEAGIVVLGAGDATAFHQVGKTLEAGLVGLHLGLLGVDVAQHALVVELGRRHLQADLSQAGLGAIQRDLELTRIEAEQHLALADVVAFLDRHVLDDAGHVGGDRQLAGADIGVVDGDDAAAGQPVIPGTDDDHGDAAQHQQRAQQTGAGAPAQRRGDGAARDGAYIGRGGLGHQASSCGLRGRSRARSPATTLVFMHTSASTTTAMVAVSRPSVAWVRMAPAS